MNKSTTYGLIKTLGYYIIGFVLAWISYVTVEQTYIHAPGLHHIIIFFFFIGGGIWIIKSSFKIIKGTDKHYNIGIVCTNLILIISLIIYIRWTLYKEEMISKSFKPDDSFISITKTKDTSMIISDNDTVFLKVQDSVIVDKVTKKEK